MRSVQPLPILISKKDAHNKRPPRIFKNSRWPFCDFYKSEVYKDSRHISADPVSRTHSEKISFTIYFAPLFSTGTAPYDYSVIKNTNKKLSNNITEKGQLL